MDQRIDAPVKKSRTYDYVVAMPNIEAAMQLSGLEYLQAMIAGKISGKPSISDTIDMTVPLDLDHGQAAVESTPGDFLLNPLGVVHGGYASTLLDTVMGIAVHTTLPPGYGFTTAELKVNLTRAIRLDTGPLRAEGKIIHEGRRISTAEGRIIGLKDGKLYAHGTTTCFIYDLREGGR